MLSKTITTQQINAVRGIVTWAVRGVALTLVATGGYLALKRVLFGIGVWDFELAFRVWEDIGEKQSFYRGVGMVLVGLPLGLWSRRIAGWVVALPPTGCPQCGYAVAPPSGSAAPSRCPECGLPLDE